MLGEEPANGGQIRYLTRTRSTIDRYYDILRTINEGESVMNKILNRAAIHWKPGKEIIDELVAKGYLTREQVSVSRHAYRITEEGAKALKTYDDIVENFSIERI